MRHAVALSLLLLAVTPACGDDDGPSTPGPDTGPGPDVVEPDAGPEPDASTDDAEIDLGPPIVASTAHCNYEPTPANANATGPLDDGTLTAGVADVPIGLPVGSALGAYTARASFLGESVTVDRRFVEISGAFVPSIGIETTPRVKVLALTAGSETLLLVKADLGMTDENVVFDVAERLGPEYRGKVVITASHSHSSFGHFSTTSALGVGFGRFRQRSYDHLVTRIVEACQSALAARSPARIGIHHEPDFDPDDVVSHDRRDQNDDLPNGANRKDHDLFVIRVDTADGAPMALLPMFGVHGIISDFDNPYASTDAPGAMERVLEETFDRPVLVMHLQGAAGDVSPGGRGGIDCSGDLGCPAFARGESVGHLAVEPIRAAWERAGDVMQDRVALEVLTRSVALGPDWEDLVVRDGALEYAPFLDGRLPDRRIFEEDGTTILSPIDEFNAPVGAALCGNDSNSLFPGGQILGTRGLGPYSSCIKIDVASEELGFFIDLAIEPAPICGTTRTTVSAIRLGDYLVSVLPGEPLTLFADYMRAHSPFPPERTLVLGYAQGHAGYLLVAEDWLRMGYEPNITWWGPLQGEVIGESAAELLALAGNETRDDAAADGDDRFVQPPMADDQVPPADPSPMAGTVPDVVPAIVYSRGGVPIVSAQPEPTIRRLETARFVWIGEDPLAGTPVVRLERETTPGSASFEPVLRGSGREVTDGDLLLYWTPDPLRRDGSEARTHYWVVDWQAVAGLGFDASTIVADRPGLALGRYRFHVEGTDYSLDSDPFEVVPAELSVMATVDATSVSIDVAYLASDGWRLLDFQVDSNLRVPLRETVVLVELVLDSDTVMLPNVTLADGRAVLTPMVPLADVKRVRVTDRFGNVGEIML